MKEAGYTAQVVDARTANAAAKLTTLPSGFALIDEALAEAKRENKPLVLEFTAEWCAPCKQMERTTLVDSRVVELLKQVVFVRIDTDRQPEIAERLGVVGLPDIRFAATNGRLLRQLRGFQTAESFAAALQQLIRQTASN
ncbi:MAG: thioredoxin domain-containing protein [Acidobacteriota bacterium]